MDTELANNYRSASRLAVAAALLFVAAVVIEVLAGISMADHIQLLESAQFGANVPLAQAEAHDFRQRVFAVLEVSATLAAWIVFLFWVYRASRNARALGAEGMAYTPGWSVGWFLVPVANLVMPYLVFKELWKASSPGTGSWQKAAVSPTIGVWWIVCAVRSTIHYSPWAIIFGKRQVSEVLADEPFFHSIRLDGLSEFAWGRLIDQVVGIAASVLTVVVIVSIANLQERRRVELEELAERELQEIA